MKTNCRFHFILFLILLLPVSATNVLTAEPQDMATSWQTELLIKPYNPEKVFEAQEWNIRLFREINSHHSPGWDHFMVFFDTLGIPFHKMGKKVDIGISWILIPLFLLTWKFRRRYFIPLIAGLLLETLIVVLLKELFPQPRPLNLLENIHSLLLLGSRSFPSGHTAMVTVIAVIMMHKTEWWNKTLWIMFCLIIAYQRIYTGAHFPLDVMTGVGVGLLSGLTILLAFKHRIKKPVQ